MSHYYYISPEDYKKAAEIGLDEKTVYSRVYQLGWSIQKAITTPKRKRSNVGWKEMKDIAKRNGVSYQVFYQRIRKYGWSKEKAATTPIMDVLEVLEINRQKQKRVLTDEQIATARQNGLKLETVYYRMKKLNWTIEDAVSTPTLSQEEICKRANRGRKLKKTKRKEIYK